ncbi:MAG: DUF4230 domain-containing protein [Verrucomicrobiota bacterium]
MAMSKRATTAVMMLIFAGGILCGLKLSWWWNPNSSGRFYNTVAILQQVKTLSELVTVQYVIEKVEGFEQPSEHLVGQLLGSENRLLLLAHGTVKAGIDLGQLKPEDFVIRDKTIYLSLPRARITDAYLDEKLTKVIDRKTGLLAPSDKDLEQTVRKNAVEDIRRAAREGGILNAAEERAQTQLRALLLQLGFEKVHFGEDLLPANGETSGKPVP